MLWKFIFNEFKSREKELQTLSKKARKRKDYRKACDYQVAICELMRMHIRLLKLSKGYSPDSNVL